TEYGYQTNPPDRYLGVSNQAQARYLGDGALRAYRAPRVDLLIHYLVRDEADVGRFQSGLFTAAGVSADAGRRRARNHVGAGASGDGLAPVPAAARAVERRDRVAGRRAPDD